MVEAAAFSAARSTGRMAAERVITSAMVSVPSRLRLSRCNSPASALVASALRNETCSRSGLGRLDHEVGGARAHDRHHIVDAAMGGLHDDGNVEAGLAHARQHAEAVEVGHHQVEHHAIDALCPAKQGQSRIAALGEEGLIAEALDHGFEQPALDGIVVDDEHVYGHWTSQRTAAVPIWCNVAVPA